MQARSMLIPALSAVIIVAACATTASQPTRSAQAEADLAKALAGRVAGPPVRCISTYHADDMQIIDDWTILFKDGRTTYVQTPRGGCWGIAGHHNILISKPMPSTQLCSGDINRVVDLRTGMGGGSCVFSPFIPYTRIN